MSKISVIVPIYNVEQYVVRCAESLFAQTLDDIEYIFVDDHTPDNSMALLQEVIARYPNRAPHTRIIHHTRNMGPEVARQTGIKAATGNYLAFVDSDDYIGPDMMQLMYDKAVASDADIVVCDFTFQYSDGRYTICEDYLSENPADWFRDMLINDRTSCVLWNKIYRRNLFEYIVTPEPHIAYAEDYSANIQLYHYARKIVRVPLPLYHYMCNVNSLTNVKSGRHFADAVVFWNRVQQYLADWGIAYEYQPLVNTLQLRMKANLMLAVKAPVRKQYGNIFSHIRWQDHAAQLKPSQRITLFLLQHRMYRTVAIIRQLLLLKTRITQ